MLTGIKKHSLCITCKNPIIGLKFTFGKKVFCWNCGNSKSRNDRTKTPYGIKLKVGFEELVNTTRLEF